MKSVSILEVGRLVTAFDTEEGEVRAADDVSFSLNRGSTLGIVGESGCGKSVTALSIMRLLPKPMGRIASGSIRFDGTDLVRLSPEEMSRVRGRRISMIFQEPMTALNPVHRIGRQLGEVYHLHFPEMAEPAVEAAAVAMLGKVGIPEPEQRMREYAHQISGGMRQRVMIAMALACRPDILIADEPTTALDVTIQAQILSLIGDLQAETGMSVIFITHDLGVIAETCDAVAVMYAGKIVETASVAALFDNPRHPYTRGLLSSIPRLDYPRKTPLNIIRGSVPGLHELPEGCRFQNRCPHAEPLCRTQPPMAAVGENHFSACHFSGVFAPLDIRETAGNRFPGDAARDRASSVVREEIARICLEVRDLKMHFPIRGGIFRRQIGRVFAVDGISFAIRRGRTLGLVGESGCGKTTVGRSILRLYQPTGGVVRFNGEDMLAMDRKQLQARRRNIQMIFQDPFESLNSRLTVGDILEEPFIIHRMGSAGERREKVRRLIDTVGMPENSLGRFPHEFSGGQRQRIGIARAIALNPEVVVCDEPVSALDVSIQSRKRWASPTSSSPTT